MSPNEVEDGDLVWLDGMYVGSLSPYERDLFDRAVEQGKARWVYEGVGGFLGLAKVKHLYPRTEGAS